MNYTYFSQLEQYLLPHSKYNFFLINKQTKKNIKNINKIFSVNIVFYRYLKYFKQNIQFFDNFFNYHDEYQNNNLFSNIISFYLSILKQYFIKNKNIIKYFDFLIEELLQANNNYNRMNTSLTSNNYCPLREILNFIFGLEYNILQNNKYVEEKTLIKLFNFMYDTPINIILNRNNLSTRQFKFNLLNFLTSNKISYFNKQIIINKLCDFENYSFYINYVCSDLLLFETNLSLVKYLLIIENKNIKINKLFNIFEIDLIKKYYNKFVIMWNENNNIELTEEITKFAQILSDFYVINILMDNKNIQNIEQKNPIIYMTIIFELIIINEISSLYVTNIQKILDDLIKNIKINKKNFEIISSYLIHLFQYSEYFYLSLININKNKINEIIKNKIYQISLKIDFINS